MARIRTIKPETFTSESIAALTLPTRWTFVGLWTYVDDDGRAKDNPKIIRGAIWPNDEDTVSSRDVEKHLNELDESDMVCRYTGNDGGKYLHVVNFKKHQVVNRPSKSRIPPCPFHDAEHAEQVKPHAPQGTRTDTSATPQSETPEGSDIAHAHLSEGSVPELGTRNRELGTGNREDDSVVMSAPAPPPPDAPDETRYDVARICTHLAERIEANGSKRPTVNAKWRNAARLMLDRDGHTEADVHAAIDWCQDSEFWRGNVLSLPKLREKYDQLRLQSQRQRGERPTATTGTNDQHIADEMAWARQMEAEANATDDYQQPDIWEEIPA